jgi:hypothetical protein
MSLATYSDLQTAVLEYRGRPGDSLVSGRVADFIALFEAKVRRRFRFRQMVTTATLTINSKFTTLPTDYLETVNLSLATSPTRDLRIADIDFLDSTYDDNTTGIPVYYAIIGSNLRVGPVPSISYTGNFTYFAFTALSGGTNWLMTNYPDIYLYGTLVEMAVWEGDAQSASGYDGALQRCMSEMAEADMNALLAGDSAVRPDIEVP